MSATRTVQQKAASKVKAAPPKDATTACVVPLTDQIMLKAGTCACGGSCPRCRGKSRLQAKFEVSQPDDRYEQEADRIADQVMRMPDTASAGSSIESTASRTLAIQRKYERCEDEEELQRKTQSVHGETLDSDLDTVAAALRQGGQPLDANIRRFFEPRFGTDFSAVRIHTDTRAAESAQDVNALAYTVGRNVVFKSGQYAPQSDSGKRLLAHELTHVVQQTEEVGDRVGRGWPILQRQTADAGEEQAPPQKPEDKAPPQPPTEGDAAAPSNAAAQALCSPKGLTRDKYLKEPGTSTGDFGLTSLDLTAVTYPELITEKAKGGVRIKPTTAALPAIPSVFTGSNTFTEGEAHFLGQNDSECPSRKYPIRWTISPAGATKIGEGEQEHCADFQQAFDISLKRYAEAVNSLARKTYGSEKKAEAALVKAVGAAPADWTSIFTCLARKTKMRDSNWHTPRPVTREPRLATDCKFVSSFVTGASLPQVGQHPSADIIKGCGEAGAVSGAQAQPSPNGSEVLTPDMSSATWDAWERGEDENAYLQRKLTVGASNDPLEQEADRIADQVMATSPNCAVSRAPPRIQPYPEQTRGQAGTAPATADQALSSPGRPLDLATRAFFEPRFGHDFSTVRVHTDHRAAESARDVNAHAYTLGRNIVFGSGQFATTTQVGRRLIAHELTHVVQQSGAVARDRDADRELEPSSGQANVISTVPHNHLQRSVDLSSTDPAVSMFLDALTRLTGRRVSATGGALALGAAVPGAASASATVTEYVQRAITAERSYTLRSGATTPGGTAVRGVGWEAAASGGGVTITVNTADIGTYTWTAEELVSEGFVNAVAANDRTDLTYPTGAAGTNLDDLLATTLPFANDTLRKTALDLIKRRVPAVATDVSLEVDIDAALRTASGVTLSEMLRGLETNTAYRLNQTVTGDRVRATYLDPRRSPGGAEHQTIPRRGVSFLAGPGRATPSAAPVSGAAPCSATVLAEIDRHLGTARTLITNALARLDSTANLNSALTTHFGPPGPANRTRIAANFRVILSEMELARHGWICTPRGSGEGCNDSRVTGRTGIGLPDVQLCIETSAPFVPRATTVLHEVVHASGIGSLPAGTEQYAWQAATYPGSDPLHNADSYAQLAADIGVSASAPAGAGAPDTSHGGLRFPPGRFVLEGGADLVPDPRHPALGARFELHPLGNPWTIGVVGTWLPQFSVTPSGGAAPVDVLDRGFLGVETGVQLATPIGGPASWYFGVAGGAGALWPGSGASADFAVTGRVETGLRLGSETTFDVGLLVRPIIDVEDPSRSAVLAGGGIAISWGGSSRRRTTASETTVDAGEELARYRLMTPWELSRVAQSEFDAARAADAGLRAQIDDFARAGALARAVFAHWGVDFDIDVDTRRPLGREPNADEQRIVDAQLVLILSNPTFRGLVSGEGGRGIPTAGDAATPGLRGRVRITRSRAEFGIRRYQLQLLVQPDMRAMEPSIDESVRELWATYHVAGRDAGGSITDAERRVAGFELLAQDSLVPAFYFPPADTIYMRNFRPSEAGDREFARHEIAHFLGGRDRTRRAFQERYGEGYLRYWVPFEEGMAQLVTVESDPTGEHTMAASTEVSEHGGTTVEVSVSSGYSEYVEQLRTLFAARTGSRELFLRAFFTGEIPSRVFELIEELTHH